MPNLQINVNEDELSDPTLQHLVSNFVNGKTDDWESVGKREFTTFDGEYKLILLAYYSPSAAIGYVVCMGEKRSTFGSRNFYEMSPKEFRGEFPNITRKNMFDFADREGDDEFEEEDKRMQFLSLLPGYMEKYELQFKEQYAAKDSNATG